MTVSRCSLVARALMINFINKVLNINLAVPLKSMKQKQHGFNFSSKADK